jgi:hypothetical protein
VTTVSITNTRSQDQSGAFARQIADQVDKIEKQLKNIDEELEIDELTTKFDNYITNQQKSQSTADATIRREM